MSQLSRREYASCLTHVMWCGILHGIYFFVLLGPRLVIEMEFVLFSVSFPFWSDFLHCFPPRVYIASTASQ